MTRKKRSKKKLASTPPRSTAPRLLPKRSRLPAWPFLAGGTLVATVAFAFFFAYSHAHGPGDGRDVELVVPSDESADGLAARLYAAGLVDSPRLFALYLRVAGGVRQVAPGTHLLTDDLSPGMLLARLERATSAGHVRVTIPEGFTRFDIAKRLQALHVCPLRSWLDATTDEALLKELHVDGPSAEGFLFPATYDFALDSAAPDLVRHLKAEFDKRYDLLEALHQPGLLELTSSLGWGRREIVTLASMVEKEAAVDDERPVIASVFLNRLREPSFSPKLLQSDPTAGYGCLVSPSLSPSCASYAGKITHDIVSDASNAYNTYKHEGLPPGPISNPGSKSIQAVMAPASTRYLYFVARGDGRHTFSETYAAHAAAVRGPPKSF